MDRYVIHGGRPLHGEIEISGAKNAAVAIIPAALMVDGVCRIENMPQISDVDMLLKILQGLGARVEYLSPSAVEIDCTQVRFTEPPYDLMRKIRASYYFIGSMLSRFGSAKTTMPGGCNFGVRPIDQHIKGMTAMGANVEVKNGFVYADTPDGRLRGAKVYLDKVSVGATMNIIIAATLARGRTVIENAAREPHIVDLANFLNSMGADIRGAGTDSIRIQGVERLHGGTYSVIPDQIEAGTYMAACAAAGGEVRLANVIPRHLECISAKLREMGVTVVEGGDSVLVRSNGRLRHTNVKTQPYPGFPTDMQPQISVALCLADGTSVVTEGVYDNRYKYIQELGRMGADAQVDGCTAIINGVEGLHGAEVRACDLRAGAAVVIAGLCATGETVVTDIRFIERGYENFVGKLRGVGADIVLERDGAEQCETHILIDAGISARRICAGLTAQDVAPADLAGVLVTHEHSDHVKGLAVLLRRDPTAVYALPEVCAALRKLLPERTDCLHEIAPGEPFCLGDVRVTPFPTPHDAAGSCGYRLDGSARFGFCTDLGTVTDAVRAALCGVDCAVIEANHDPELLRTGPYPIYLKRRIASDHGHLSNESAGALAVYLAENGAQQLILGHLSRENNTPRSALETVSLALAAAGFQPGTQPELYAAPAETTLALTAGKACVCCR